MLIADVYNSIRSNKALWESTLLVITSDEHGGFYDHVEPPYTVPPDDHTAEWSFDRLGVRVPTILVSPWIEKSVIKTVFDHTSLLRYLCEKWNLEPLGARMQESAGAKRARNFADELRKLTSPRTDTPEKLVAAGIPRALRAQGQKEPPIIGSREALLMFVDQLPEKNLPGTTSKLRRVEQVQGKVSPALSVAAAEAKLEALRTHRKSSAMPKTRPGAPSGKRKAANARVKRKISKVLSSARKNA